jgi:hypothetical protein
MNNYRLAQTTKDPAILDELSKDEHYYVHYAVAENPNTTPETLNYLSKDKNFNVRYRVAENPNTTLETLNYLSKDENCLVRCYVADNSNTTPEILKEMAKVETDSYVKELIKNNPNCSEETWKYLSALELIESLSEVST